MSGLKLFSLTLLAMLAFAGNSLLCRAALLHTSIDPATFTTVRLVAGAMILGVIVSMRHSNEGSKGSWLSGFWLFLYAAAFSFAYVGLSAAVGALLLFGVVQITMIAAGLWRGERLQALQEAGFLSAFGGLVVLLLPGLSAPPWQEAALMILAGIAWGMYSLRGQGKGSPVHLTAGNFLKAVPYAVVVSLAFMSSFSVDTAGLAYAVMSGALTSGLGYAVWYAVLPALRATDAAVIQLSVPVIAAVGGVILLNEVISVRLVLASTAILGGIALVITRKRQS